MPTSILSKLEAEAKSGFPRLRGARISGTIPVTDAVVNAFMANFRVTPNVRILGGKRIVATVMGVPIEATIIDISPSLTLTLTLPWLARKLAARAPHVRLDGQYVLVDLAAFPQLSNYGYLLRHLTSIDVQTSDGKMLLLFQLTIM